LVLTDGLANSGVVNRETLAIHAGELRQRGIVTSTFGVGADFDERLLRDMAMEGGGNFYFIENARQIPDLITSELGEALEVVMPRAALTLTIPRGAEAEVMSRFTAQKLHGESAIRIELGDLVSGQELNIVIKVKFPHGEIGNEATASATLGGDVALFEAESRLTWRYANHSDNDEQPRDVTVDREVARVYAARARAEATEANRFGDFEKARSVLVRTSRRISEYAGNDPVLTELSSQLRAEVHEYAEVRLDAMMLKTKFYAAEVAVRERGFDGKAKRRVPR
ncbi:MAG: VWA domain-containing protein, partial [Gemmatimonadota bacterium]|nr:VWA domain-containing protein [Gemmatimonadota bacterium]